MSCKDHVTLLEENALYVSRDKLGRESLCLFHASLPRKKVRAASLLFMRSCERTKACLPCVVLPSFLSFSSLVLLSSPLPKEVSPLFLLYMHIFIYIYIYIYLLHNNVVFEVILRGRKAALADLAGLDTSRFTSIYM